MLQIFIISVQETVEQIDNEPKALYAKISMLRPNWGAWYIFLWKDK